MNGEDEEIGNTKYCPYSKIKNMVTGVFGSGKNDQGNNTISTEDTEKAIPKGKCPFGYDNPEKKQEKCPFGYESKSSNGNGKEKPNEGKTDTSKKIEDIDEDSEDDKPTGGCPVMNKGKKDPQNKHFEPFYEIPCFGAYDFIFFLRGSLETDEWLKKTEKIRSYPRHMKYTLFYQAQEKLQKVHEREFPMVFFIYDDIKQKANRLFRRKKYREAIEHLTYAYGLLKWIQFKDKKRQADFIKKPSLDGILDEDIEEKIVYLDDVKVEEDSFKACVVYLLEILAYAHLELRQYHCAIEALDECVPIAEDKVPDLFFRRSQARTYNRNSEDEDLEKAMQDIDKAILLKNEPIYKEHKEILTKIIQTRTDTRVANIRKLIEKAKRSHEKIKDRQLSFDEFIFTKNEDSNKQYKILKEMKSKYNLAVKFFTETKNEEQLVLTYKEFESFHESYNQFKFYYKFKACNIDPKAKASLTPEEQALLTNDDFNKLIDEYKFKVCENVFGDGNYNIELFQYALEKVFEEERKAEEEREKAEEALKPKVSWSQYLCNITKSNYVKYFSALFILLSIGAIIAQYFMYSGSPFGHMFR